MVSGKQFRDSLKKPLPGAKGKPGRLVPAFTIQAMQKDTRVIPPPKLSAVEARPVPNSRFRDNYHRGNLPISMEAKGGNVKWKVRNYFFKFFILEFKIDNSRLM